MRHFTLFTLLLASVALVNCDKTEPSAAPKLDAPPAGSQAAAKSETLQEHAPKGAKPGSHADWCGEHQVPESMCTRCNASLIAGFKATNDWCQEHGLPESQCLKCNPDLKITRPPPEAK